MSRSIGRAVVTSRWTAVAVTIGIFVLLLRRVPIDPLVAALEQADYGLFLAVMMPNTVFYFCWDTLVLTTVVRWFHRDVRYRDLLPVRAASYVVALFNANLGRGALAAYLSRQMGSPFLQLGSTVLFLLLTEYLHLVAWATIGIFAIESDVSRELLWVPPAVAALWLAVFSYARVGARSGDADRLRGPAEAERHTLRGPAEAERHTLRGPAEAGHHTPQASSVVVSAFRRTSGRVVRWLLAPRDWALLRTFRLAPARRYLHIVLLRAPMFFVSLCFHYVAARAFGVTIPFLPLLAFLPIIFMIAALPITVAHLGTTQAAWIFFFSAYAPEPRLLAFSLAAHLAFVVTRGLLGVAFLPWAYADLVKVRDY